jgi:hypothetical protein
VFRQAVADGLCESGLKREHAEREAAAVEEHHAPVDLHRLVPRDGALARSVARQEKQEHCSHHRRHRFGHAAIHRLIRRALVARDERDDAGDDPERDGGEKSDES